MHDEHDGTDGTTNRDRLRAVERHHGPDGERRHHGVYHEHRHRGWHPHPHVHAARRRALEGPGGEMAGGTAPFVAEERTPLHHHQHSISARHLHAPRRAAPVLEVGTVVSYDAASGTALVSLLGSPARVIGPAAVTACAPHAVPLAGMSCLLVLLDAYNPRDGVVVALWPAS